MKKTKTKLSAEMNFDLDSSLDIPDFDFMETEVKDDRKPVTALKDGVLQGAKEQLTNPDTIRKAILKALPEEYGKGYSQIDSAAGSIKQLYDESVKNARTGIKDIKRVTNKIIPGLEGKLSKKWTDRIKKWAAEEEYSGTAGRDSMRDDSITMQLGDIFRTKDEADAARQEANDTKEAVRQGIEQTRFRDQFNVLDTIRQNTTAQVAYQDRVLANYQKKSLELQFRQYFATVDLLESTRETGGNLKQQLEAIRKNTALPEYVKITNSERFAELSKTKIFETVRSSLFGNTQDVLKTTIDNILKTVKGKVTDGIGDFNDAASALEMLSSTSDGMNPYELGGNILGSMGADVVSDNLAKRAGKYLGKNKHIRKGAAWLNYNLNNSDHVMNDYFRPRGGISDFDDDTGAEITGPRAWLNSARRFVGEHMPSRNNAPEIQVDNLDTLGQPAYYSSAANKSITEIIPGLLARQLKELTWMRSGQEPGLVAYDFETNSFSDKNTLAKRTRAKVVTDYARQMTREGFDSIFQDLDPSGEKLSSEERSALEKILLSKSVRNESTDARALLGQGGLKGLDRKQLDKIRGLLSTYLKTDEGGRRDGSVEALENQSRLSRKIRELSNTAGDPRVLIQRMANAGQIDVLRAAGLLEAGDKDGSRLDIDSFQKLLLGEDPNGLMMSTVPTDGYARRSMRGRRGYVGVRQEPLKESLRSPDSHIEGTSAQTTIAVDAIKQITDSTDKISSTLRELSNQELLTLISQHVASIDERLASGILTLDVGEAMDEVGGRISGLAGRAGQSASRFGQGLRSRFADLRLGDLVSSAKRFGKGALGHANRLGSQLFKTGRSAFNTGMALTRSTLGMAGNTLQAIADQFGDIYVKGEIEPRLTRAKLKAGAYRDQATGKVITSLKDIRGTIVDEDGNVILSVDEIKDSVMRVKGKVIRLASVVHENAMKFAKFGLNTMRGMVRGVYGLGIDVAAKTFRFIKDNLPPYDVYVKGEMEVPVMYAAYMRQEVPRYFSEQTGKPIKHPKEVDGPVKDKDGNYVVTPEQFGKGLVNKDGRSINNMASRALGRTMRYLGKGIDVIKSAGKKAWDVITGLGRGFMDFFNASFGLVFGVKGEFLDTHKQQLETQIKIYKLLDERLAGKKVTGDNDGDGLRDGSAQQLLKEQRLKDELKGQESTSGSASKVPGGGQLGALFGGLKKLFSKKSKSDDQDDDDDGDTNIDIDLGNNNDGGRDAKSKKQDKSRRKSKAPKTPKGKSGFGRRLLGGAGKLAKGVGRGVLGAGKLAGNIGLGLLGGGSGVSGAVARGVGGAAMGLGRIGVGLASSLIPGALGALGSFAGLSWGGLAAGLGALVASPVFLGALGVGALGALGYGAYKYLTRAKLDILSTVRYAQYGFPEDDKDHLGAVFQLEDMVRPAVVFDGEKPSLDEKKLDFKKWAEAFGVQAPAGNNFENWMEWFTRRFKPVFLTHLTVLRTMAPNVALSEVDGKLTLEDRKKYLNATSMPSGPYEVTNSPFADLKALTVGPMAVGSAVEVARAKLDKEKSKDTKTAPTAVAGAAALASATGPDGKPRNAATMAQDGSDGNRELEKRLKDTDVATSLEAGTPVSVRGKVSDYLFTGQEGRLDALTSVRMKVYGLTSMDMEKIKALRQLEYVTRESTMTQGEGSVFNGDVEKILELVKPSFGITGARSPQGYDWMVWYKARFLPVYLAFVSGLQKATKKTKIEEGLQLLKPQESLNLANLIIGTSTVYERRKVTVWEVDKSPWYNYPIGTDSDIVKGNIEYMTNAVKAVIQGEQTSEEVRQRFADDQKRNVNDKKAPDPNVMSETAGGAAVGTRRDPASMSRQRAAFSTQAGQVARMTPDGTGVQAIGDFKGGVPVRHPGNGTGGDINSLPNSQGSGYQANKDLITAVAKMAGVDEQTLAAYIGIESDWSPDAKPPVDKNTGKRASGATGLGQFIPGTWNDMLNRKGGKYGIAVGTPPEDPRANALMTAEYMLANTELLRKVLKREPTMTDLYLAHFLGPGDVQKFLKADPDTAADAVMSTGDRRDPVRANPTIFYDKSGRARTFRQIYDMFTKRIDEKMAQVKGASGSGPVSDTTKSVTDGAAPPSANRKIGYGASVSTSATQSLVDATSTYVKTSATVPAPQGSPTQVPVPSSPMAPKPDVVQAQAPKPAAPPPLPTTRSPEANVMRSFVPRTESSRAEIQGQSNALAEQSAARLGNIDKTLLDSLNVQREMDKTLKSALDVLVQISKNGTPASAVAPTPTASQPRVQREATKVPISMRKGSFANN